MHVKEPLEVVRLLATLGMWSDVVVHLPEKCLINQTAKCLRKIVLWPGLPTPKSLDMDWKLGVYSI